METLVKMFSGIKSAFVGIRDYTNKYGEVSNYTILIGSNRYACKERDIAKLKLALQELEGVKLQACLEMIQSLEKPSETRSEAQTNAYTIITDGVKVHNDTGQIYVYGRKMAKVVKVKGEYPVVNSRPKTLAKRELENELKLESHLYRQYILDNINQIAIVGRVLDASNGFEFGVEKELDVAVYS